MRISFVKYLQF
uniref:Uncharacterized protein n=1 Tax=Anguilla anguilla TaxID=7936 RepID=A0A0E9R5S8_ANGAN